MVAQIEGFQTRKDLGLLSPRSVSYNITPHQGGLAGHWNGPRITNTNHSDCIRAWKMVQEFHMAAPRNWVDIAYSLGFCNHGYVLAGRGYGVRTAANGTNYGNQYFHAAYWIGGEGQTPTTKAYNAFDWIVVDFRKKGGGRRVLPHRDFTGSACPGPHFIKHCRSRDNQNVPQGGIDMSQYGPENWDAADRRAFTDALNNAIVKHTESNFAWHVRRLERLGTANLESLNALTKVVESRTNLDPQELAKTVADELGESLEEIGRAAGKAAAEVTATDVVRRHAEALMEGVGNN